MTIQEVRPATDERVGAETVLNPESLVSSRVSLPLSALLSSDAIQSDLVDRPTKRWATGYRPVVKRTMDLVIGLLALVTTFPILVLAALAVRLTSRGPTLFRGERIGIDGQHFQVLKLRTMYHNAPADIHVSYVTERLSVATLNTKAGQPGVESVTSGGFGKLLDDPRVTRVGRLLRALSVDELPQLLNVLRGNMSLVGPRPALIYEAACYEGWQWRRLDVRPGMTGLWQVSGRSRISINDMLRLDVEYAETWSPWQDFKLLLRTIPAVLRFADAR